jgi:hypothetical protein
LIKSNSWNTPIGPIVIVTPFTLQENLKNGLGSVQQLLDRIIDDYSSLEYAYIEAYPRSGDLSEEKLYRGPLDLLNRNGFEKIKEFEEYILVRKRL